MARIVHKACLVVAQVWELAAWGWHWELRELWSSQFKICINLKQTRTLFTDSGFELKLQTRGNVTALLHTSQMSAFWVWALLPQKVLNYERAKESLTSKWTTFRWRKNNRLGCWWNLSFPPGAFCKQSQLDVRKTSFRNLCRCLPALRPPHVLSVSKSLLIHPSSVAYKQKR